MKKAMTLIVEYPTGSSPHETSVSYEVESFNYMFDKDYDRKGNVVSKVKGGNICLTLSALPTDELMRWVFDPHRLVNGKLLCHDGNNGKKECCLSFEQARCVRCRINYSLEKATQLNILLTVNATKITMENIIFFNN